jgi:hypothetical protein
MVPELKARWKAFKQLPPGQRFETHYRDQRKTKNGRSPLRRALFLLGAVLAFGIGVVLVFIPGPAVVFFALSGALLATQSLAIARAADRAELWLRAKNKAARRWWEHRSSSRKAERRLPRSV